MEKPFLKILANNLILQEKIETTESRARELRPFVEQLVSYGKKQKLAVYRLLLKCGFGWLLIAAVKSWNADE